MFALVPGPCGTITVSDKNGSALLRPCFISFVSIVKNRGTSKTYHSASEIQNKYSSSFGKINLISPPSRLPLHGPSGALEASPRRTWRKTASSIFRAVLPLCATGTRRSRRDDVVRVLATSTRCMDSFCFGSSRFLETWKTLRTYATR